MPRNEIRPVKTKGKNTKSWIEKLGFFNVYPLEEAEEDIADEDLGSGDASLKTQRHSSSHSDSVSVRPHWEFWNTNIFKANLTRRKAPAA